VNSSVRVPRAAAVADDQRARGQGSLCPQRRRQNPPAEDLDQLREWIQRRMTAFPQGNA
jgi:hypothetical protein